MDQQEVEALIIAPDEVEQLGKSTADKLSDLSKDHTQLQNDKWAMGELLTEVKGDLHDLQGKYSILEDVNKSTQEDNQQAQKEIAELKQARDESVVQRKDTGEKLRGLRVDNGELQGANRSLENQLQDTSSKLKAFEAKYSTNERDVLDEQLQKEITDLKIARDAATTKLYGLEAANSSHMNERDVLDEKLLDATRKLADLAADKENLSKERAAQEEERGTLLEKNEALDNSGERSDHQLQVALDKIGMLEAKLKLAEVSPSRPEEKLRGLDFVDETDPSQDENDALLKELAKSKTENARVQGELQTVLEHDLSGLKTVHSSMQGGIKEANDGMGALEEGIQVAKNIQQKELEASRSNLKAVMDEIETMTAEVDNLSQEFLATKLERDALQTQLDRVNQEIEAGAPRDHNENRALGSMRGEKEDKHSDELQALKAERGDLKAKLGERDYELQESQYALKKSEGLVDRYGRKIKKLEADVKEARDEKETWEDKNAVSERRYAGETRALKSKRDGLKSDLDLLKVELQKSQASKKKVETLAETLRRKIAELENEVVSTQNEMDGKVKHNMDQERAFSGQIRALEFERSDLKARLDSLGAREASLGSELSTLETATLRAEQEARRIMESLRGDLASSDKAKQEANRAREALSKELDEANQIINELTKDNELLSQQKKARHLEVENVRIETEAIKKENGALNNRVSNLETQKDEYDKLKKLQNEYEKLKEAHQNVNFASRSAVRDTEDISRKLGARDAEVKQLRERTSAHEDLKEEHRELRKAHQGVVKASRDAAVALSRQLDERKTEIENLKVKLRKSGSENFSRKEKLRKLEDENKKNQVSLKEAQNSLEDAMAKVKQLQADRERKALDCEELLVAKDTLQESLEEAESLVEKLRNQLSADGEANNENTERLTRDLMRTEKQSRENGRQLNDAKAKLREMALERRNVQEAHENESNALKRRASLLVSAGKDNLDTQKKTTEKEMIGLRETVASRENLSRSLERKGQIASQMLSERVKFLEEKLSAAELQRENLEQELVSAATEQEGLSNEIMHAHSKLEEALSMISGLQSSFESAESGLSVVTRGFTELLQTVPSSDRNAGGRVGEGKGPYNNPAHLVDRVKVEFGNTMRSRDEALETGRHLETALIEAHVLADGLQTKIAEKEGILVELQTTAKREKEDVMAELQELDLTVEQVASDTKGLISQLHAQLQAAEDENEILKKDMLDSKEAQESLFTANEALEKSLNEHMAALDTLKEKADQADNEHAELHAAKENLQISLNEEMTAESKPAYSVAAAAAATQPEQVQQMDNRDSHARRVAALELSLAEKDRKLRQVDEEKRVLREDALKLKRFLGASLEEAKLLLNLLTEARLQPESSHLGAHLIDNEGKHSSSDHVFERLETMVKTIGKEVNGMNQRSRQHHSWPLHTNYFQDSKMSAQGQRARRGDNNEKGGGKTTGVDSTYHQGQEEATTLNPTQSALSSSLASKSRAPPGESPAEKRRKTATTSATGVESLDREMANEGILEGSPLSNPISEEGGGHLGGAVAKGALREDMHEGLSDIAKRGQEQKWKLHSRGTPTSHLPLRENQRRPVRALHRKTDQDAYVQQRLARSAATTTAPTQAARSFPYRSIEELIEPASAGIMGRRMRASGAPFYSVASLRSHGRSQVYSDPEVFNSPFIRSSNFSLPKRTPLLIPEERGRPLTFYRRPLTVPPSSLGGPLDKRMASLKDLSQAKSRARKSHEERERIL